MYKKCEFKTIFGLDSHFLFTQLFSNIL